MSYLFIIEGRSVFPHPEALLIRPFKQIWAKDKTKGKEQALLEFAYMEFMVSMRKSNIYSGYRVEDKPHKILKGIGMKAGWKPYKLILEGIEFLSETQHAASPSWRHYQASLSTVEAVQEFLEGVDPEATNFKTGNYMLKPADITKATKETTEQIKQLKAFEKKIDDEIITEDRTRAGKKISYFSRAESFNDQEEF